MNPDPKIPVFRFLSKGALSAVSILCICLTVHAHEGGHYHRNDESILNSWTLKNGTVIRGNFLKGDQNEIILEQYEGKMQPIRISELSAQDQQLARFKIKRSEQRNAPVITLSHTEDNGTANPVYGFTVLFCIALCCFVLLRQSLHPYFRLSARQVPLIIIGSLIFTAWACKKNKDQVVTITIPKTSTSFIDAAFTPFKPSISTRWDDNWFYVSSGGFPAHGMMVGITSWQQQVPIPQSYTGTNSWAIPLQPVYATKPLSTRTNFMKGAVAIAVNGLPVFNALNNRGDDAYLFGELDNWGGHCGRADDYHYHIAPLGLAGSNPAVPVAFAMDGFAVYGSQEPDGSGMQALDTCHGHVIGNGVYHYHGTNTYPYVIGAMRGQVNIDPATPAPENQILPQAFASPLRPALTPLNGARITSFASTGLNAFQLIYQIGAKNGSVGYSWDATNKYTFVFTDTAGHVTTSVYNR